MKYTDTIQTLFTAVARYAKNVKPAILAIVLFLSVVFTFAVKSDVLNQTTQTAMVPEVQVEETQAPDYVVGMELEKMEALPPQEIDSETLWLARGIYSETKRPQEQELVAWTIRNRVETNYRGNESYKEAVLDPYQFSAFIEGTDTRAHYSSLTAESEEPGFKNAVAIAKQVKEAPDSLRPFSETTRHFFSEQSMVGGEHPDWSIGETPVTPERPIQLDDKRFRFYEDIG